MKLVAVVPPSERLAGQAAMIGSLFSGHDAVVATGRAELERHLADVEVLVSTAFTPLTREMLIGAKRLRFIQVAGTGYDHVDLPTAQELGITVAAVWGANSSSVAEHVIMTALALLRSLIPAHLAMQENQWSLGSWMGRARDLAGKTVGILGMGRIGREVATRLLPFQTAILYYDMRRLPSSDEDTLGVTYVEFDTLLSESDILTLHLPLLSETQGILNRKTLARMKSGALLINTARQELVDVEALAEAIKSNHLGGAAFDVFSPEPPSPDNPLLQMPNVILTPHGAGVTIEAQERIAQAAIKNVLRFLDGHPLADVVVEGDR
jgi:phosphoglycerate dehydrogenase-like enzyme